MKALPVAASLAIASALCFAGCQRAAAPGTAAPVGVPSVSALDDAAELVESTVDSLGIYRDSPNYQAVIDAGARVVDVPAIQTFFVLWVPEGYQSGSVRRVLTLAHGSRGSAYAEIDQELDPARQHGYALLAVQWWLPASDYYLEPDEVYALLSLALQYMQQHYATEPDRAAYSGFSRGAAISYEVTFYDRQAGTDYFALTISHSGGVPVDGGRPFFEDLSNGLYGSQPFAGSRFFMYCGMQDEFWGTEQCEQMHNAESIVREYGATIEQFIEAPDGGHAGLRDNPDYHEQAIAAFLRLTAE